MTPVTALLLVLALLVGCGALAWYAVWRAGNLPVWVGPVLPILWGAVAVAALGMAIGGVIPLVADHGRWWWALYIGPLALAALEVVTRRVTR